MKKLVELLKTFMKIGGFTFGGGYAMLSIIENECVERKKWITHEEMMRITVIAESTPGPIAVNCATFVGYQQAGMVGAIAATLGIVFPSFVVIYLISIFLDDFLKYDIIASAFHGIKIAVGLLIFQVGIKMRKKMSPDRKSHLIMLVSCAVVLCVDMFAWKVSTIVMIVLSGMIGVMLFGRPANIQAESEE